MTTYSIVIPSIGRSSLWSLLGSIARSSGPAPSEIVVVDDSPAGRIDRLSTLDAQLDRRIRVVRTGGRGPAAARNAGWRTVKSEWVAFLDDDVAVTSAWRTDLMRDLAGAAPQTAASQGDLRVPLDGHRRLTDWERNVQGLQNAPWISADIAYRRSVLDGTNGFDERFKRAYREDADLALRTVAAGYRIERGTRVSEHPVRSTDRWVSVRLQAGNADDVLMQALHGSGWYERAGSQRGTFDDHRRTAGAFAQTLSALIHGRYLTAGIDGAQWIGRTLQFAWKRIAPGPRDLDEVVAMAATSFVIPFAAVYHRKRGCDRVRALFPRAVLFDRDGTLIHDTHVRGDAARVQPVAGAARAIARLRSAGIAIGVVTNQPSIANGDCSAADVAAVHRRVEALIGSIDAWCVCPHGSAEACTCRKPQPGLITQAAAALKVGPQDCIVVGDIGSDMEAARAAGARSILVPNGATRQSEVIIEKHVAADLNAAVDLILAHAV